MGDMSEASFSSETQDSPSDILLTAIWKIEGLLEKFSSNTVAA